MTSRRNDGQRAQPKIQKSACSKYVHAVMNGKDKAIHLRLDDVDFHAFQALSARQARDVDKKVPCRHLLTELLLQEVDLVLVGLKP